ncbi:histidinol-phosphatase [Vibrio sp. SCSIO 43137]|uniref:histidinol-phosphatase n=1 Tax=Vibrio sp. SCSIO 43137 TaxID=3021011 RepID=UPI0023074808|nr:histidinol-phosphatase [Vibrio sp. SCSIO 43137]WCE32542.1 histidinol-phosphatase [Vibrio sp. SCSIO 43137]
MRLTNYHTHCHYCDGKGTPEEVVNKAVELGYEAIGFSSHAPLPFANDYSMQEQDLPAYLDAVNKQKSRHNIEVYLGLEIDFLEGYLQPADSRWKTLGLDYVIGSVHGVMFSDEKQDMMCVDGLDDDMDFLLNDIYQGNGRRLVEDYYQKVSALCQAGGFDILGHYDLVKKHNLRLNFFDESESWYRDIAISTLDDVAKSGVIMEVNFGGILRGSTKDVYPPLWLMKQANRRNIPMQINADAHAPHHLGVHQEHCRDLMLQAGYKSQRVLLNNRWQDIGLE